MSQFYGFIHRFYIRGLIEDALNRKKQSVDLGDLDIEEIPDALFHTCNFRKLFLHRNKIVSINSNIERWQNLTVLTLDYNRLTSLPIEIKQLRSLQYLNVSHNPLKKIPPEIGDLISLEALWCNCIALEVIPGEICKLSNLHTFGARKNKIKCLPKDFIKLIGLSWITLQDNVIEELPEGLSALPLIHLNVSLNCLRELPKDLPSYKQLQYLFVNNNQINCLPLSDSTKWDLSGMEALYYIDIRENPIVKDAHFKEHFQSYPQLKCSNELPPIDESAINSVQENRQQAIGESNNTTINDANINESNTNENDMVRDNFEDGESDSSSDDDDWEHSTSSSHLNYAEHSDDDLEENEIEGIDIPVISKFAGTGS